jgi:hypothetical protein
MKAARPVIAAGLLALAVLLAVLTVDVLRWRDAMHDGDRELAASPATASWHADTLAPGDPVRWLLGLDPALKFRAAAQSFAAVQAAGDGYDNGVSEAQTRGELEDQLASIALSNNHTIASAADNLLGILAFDDATTSGPIEPAPVDQSVGDFQAAVRAEPGNVAAKYNLELLLRLLVAKGVRHGSTVGGSGSSTGQQGAGGGIPGRGY